MKFDYLKSRFFEFASCKNEIVENWVKDEIVLPRLKHNGISPKFFADHFAGRIIDYALGVVSGEKPIGNCPVVHIMLQMFKEKDIPLNDIFIICAGLKNEILRILLDKNMLTQESINEVVFFMDKNFEGVLKEYLYEELINIEQSEEQEHKSKEIRRIISAVEYIDEVSVDSNDLDEMRELEDEAIAAMANEEFLSESGRDKFIKAANKYSKILSYLLEFGGLGYSLGMLSEIIAECNINTLCEQTRKRLPIFCGAIIEDLQTWRIAVFENADAKDIHWMDDGFLSSISQLQVMLMPNIDDNDDELELF